MIGPMQPSDPSRRRAGPDAAFWQAKFEAGSTPWDRGAPGPQLPDWVAAGVLAPCRILVPGCGSGHEVEWLARAGFDVVGLDYATAAVERARARLATLPAGARARAEVVQADALDWAPARAFDAIYEQTCLCALHPDDWVAYGLQLHRWLAPGARLFAMLAQVPREGARQGLVEGPPYHCDVNAMRAVLPSSRWAWPKPPYPRIAHPMGMAELAVVLGRLDAGAAD
jgi:SAM-dependent methyltransferase